MLYAICLYANANVICNMLYANAICNMLYANAICNMLYANAKCNMLNAWKRKSISLWFVIFSKSQKKESIDVNYMQSGVS